MTVSLHAILLHVVVVTKALACRLKNSLRTFTVLKLRFLLLLGLVAICGLGFPSSTASAHNTLLSSDPADGSTLPSAPTQMVFTFDNAVPLNTMSLELIDATGVRTDVTALAHGTTGDTEVMATLPSIAAGEVTVRWRLVGPDGHPITGRVGFTVAAAATTTALQPATTALAAGPTIPPTSISTTTIPSAVIVDSDSGSGFAEPWTTPDPARWLLRAASYVAILLIGGIVATSAFVWPDALRHDLLRRLVVYALAAVAGLALVQLLMIASDIEAAPLWSSWGGVSAAFETHAGTAFGLRIVLAACVGSVLFLTPAISDRARWTAAGVGVTLLLGTWAFAGHSRSMRWPVIGIPLDVAHHAAAAAWLGGLAIVGLVAARECSVKELTGVAQRFAQVAKVSVIVIVATGVLQALRLVGSPTRLFEANHGRYLVLKLLVLGIMLWVADVNRRRVTLRFQRATTATRVAVGNLRRAMATELGVGLVIIGITAAMVVSPPAVAEDQFADASDTVTTNDTTAVVLTTLPTTTAPTVRLAAPDCTMDEPIQLGSNSDDVRCLQQALIALEYLPGSASGEFDQATDAAVREYQAALGLSVDGVVGPVTAESLDIWAGA